ncbi:MAG: cyanophycin synthetase [bacterium]|nr:cyanophycin synthetase [bacterium]
MPKTKKPNRRPDNPAHSVASLFKQLGREEKIKVRLEPAWQQVGKITRPDGTATYFRGTNFDLNGLGATEIARDKGYAAYFLKLAGFRVIPGKTFYSPKFARQLNSRNDPTAAYEYAKNKIGWPVVVKPNSLSQGRLVCVADDKPTFAQAAQKICRLDRVFLVQPLLLDHDYRVVILDGEVISAYERLPLFVIGDGIATIDELLNKKQKKYEASGRDTTIDKRDFRIDLRLKRHYLNRASVLAKGQIFNLLDNRNLSTGGEAIDATDEIHSSYKNLAVKIVRGMGLRYCGVDLMVQSDIKKPLDPRTNNYYVIEINSAPGIDNYAKSGAKQKKIVKEIYRKILKKLNNQ